MGELPTIVMWMGKRADELTREELIEALTWAVRELQEAREAHIRSMDMMRMFQEARRARARALFGGMFGE